MKREEEIRGRKRRGYWSLTVLNLTDNLAHVRRSNLSLPILHLSDNLGRHHNRPPPHRAPLRNLPRGGARLRPKTDGPTLLGVVAVIQVPKVPTLARKEGAVAVEREGPVAADGEAVDGRGVVLRWVVELELKGRGDVAGAVSLVL